MRAESKNKKNKNKKIEETWLRSLVKTATYRVLILLLDFAVIYFLTKKFEIALAFMIGSNIYTTLGYYIHERIWNKIKWGIEYK
jgi:adenylylsulfate kinase